MTAVQPMQVEVNVQDCFFESSEGSSVVEGDRSNPIESETWEGWFRRWLEHLQPTVSSSGAYEVTLRLTDDHEIQTLNAQYRQKDQPTDVLAFAALEVDYPHIADLDETLPLYLGDIVISIETARSQAQHQGHSLKQELAWLATHGLLHLLGWDHPDDEHLQQMLQEQDVLLQTVGLNFQYAESAVNS